LRGLVARPQAQDVLELVGQDLIAPDYDERAVTTRHEARAAR